MRTFFWTCTLTLFFLTSVSVQDFAQLKKTIEDNIPAPESLPRDLGHNAPPQELVDACKVVVEAASRIYALPNLDERNRRWTLQREAFARIPLAYINTPAHYARLMFLSDELEKLEAKNIARLTEEHVLRIGILLVTRQANNAINISVQALAERVVMFAEQYPSQESSELIDHFLQQVRFMSADERDSRLAIIAPVFLDYFIKNHQTAKASALVGASGHQYISKNQLAALRKISAYSVGTGGGGALYYPAINPQDGNNIFMVCDMGSNFYTKNGIDFRNPGIYSGISRMPRFFFNPHDENIVYATSSNVVNISYNKGETWEYFFPQPNGIAGVTNDGHFVRAIVKPVGVFARSDVICVYVHPTDPNTVFVFSKGFGAGYNHQNIGSQSTPEIYVTRNGGVSWQIFNNAIPGGGISIGDNGAFSGVISGEGLNDQAFPYADMVVFKNELHLLSNHGYFRFNLVTGALIDHRIYRNHAGHFVISKDGEMITAYQIIRRDDFNDQYNNAGYTTFPGFVSMGLAPFSTLYPRHVFKTTDYGNTFELVSGNFATDLVYTFHGLNRKMHSGITSSSNTRGYVNLKDISVSDDGTLFSVFSAIGRDSSNTDLSGGWESGVAKTTNDGETWEWVQSGNGRTVPASIQFPTGVYPVHSTADPGHSQRGLSVAKFNTNHIITYNGLDACETRDGGQTWRTMVTQRIIREEKTLWQTTGIEPAGQMTHAINPSNHQHHFAGWTDIGAWESFDGGETWARRIDMAGAGYIYNCSAVAFDPHNEGVVLVADPNQQRDAMRGGSSTGYVTVSSGVNWETLTGEAIKRKGTIRRSVDGGKTWTVVQPYIIVGIDGLVFDPIHPGVVYAGTMGGGVCRSVDGGINWHPFNTGMPPQERTISGVDYIGIQIQRLILGKDKKTLLALYGGTAGMYSLDIGNNATTWQEIPRSEDMLTVRDMDKAVDGTLYVAPSARVATSGWGNFNGAQIRPILLAGAFVSKDNGLTWRQIFDPRIPVQVLRTASHNENIIYLGGGNRIWVSHKGKDTTLDDWVELAGFHFVNPDLIIEDPTDSTRIYVTTWGGGTWSLPVAERKLQGIVSGIDAQRGQ